MSFKQMYTASLCTTMLICAAVHNNAFAAVSCPDKAWTAGLYEHGVLFFNGRSGIDQDVVDEIRKRTGCKIYTGLMPRARIWHDLEQGDLDLSVSGMKTPERLGFAWFIPYMQMKSVVLLAPTVPLSVKHAEDFIQRPDLIFGAVRSFKHGQFNEKVLEQLTQQNRLQYYPDSRTLFKALKQQRVHAIFAQAPVYRHLIPELQLSPKLRIQDWAPQEAGIEHGLVLAKSSFTEQQAQEWRQLMQDIKQDGTLLAIFKTYLPADEALALMVH
ncbi:MAG: transporter substrate-binding domain-containing protein [Pararheinheimera sp.]|nr:transporter substrate-binding domain-containing protein [Rheinheimera sp.]